MRSADPSLPSHRRQRTPASTLPRRVLVAVDLFALVAAWTATLAGPSPPGRELADPHAAAVVAAATAAGLAALMGHRLYRARVCAIRAAEHRGLLRTAVVTGAAAWLAARASGVFVPALQLASGATITFLALVAARAVYRAWLRHRREAGSFRRPVLILGEGEDALMVSSEMQAVGSAALPSAGPRRAASGSPCSPLEGVDFVRAGARRGSIAAV